METNLNRSLSAPDVSCEPVCRRVFVEEFYYKKNSLYPIRKQISCDQFPIFTGREYLPIENIPDNNHGSDTIKSNSLMAHNTKFDDSPMDIDLDESTTDLQTKMGPVETSTPTTLQNCKVTFRGRKPIIIKTEPEEIRANEKDEDVEVKKIKVCRRLTEGSANKTDVEDEKTKKKSKLPIIITIIIGIAMVPIYDHYSYNRIIDTEKIRIDLENNVVHQSDQIKQIVKTLEKINTVSNKHVLTFIGTTGVGKTYCANFIKRGFKPNQIYEISLESYDSKSLLLHRDVPYLLVIDNLRIADVDRIVQFLDALPIDKSLLIVTIFNIQDTEDHSEYMIYTEYLDEIPKLFEASQYMIEAVKLNAFTGDVVKDYYRVLTKGSGVSEEFFRETVDEHNFKHFGLKGFFAKLNLS